jgi:hypothetical protein
MSKAAIISVDGHVRASRSDYRNDVERRFLDAGADAAEAAGAPPPEVLRRHRMDPPRTQHPVGWRP